MHEAPTSQALRELRRAIVDEYIDKLPEHLTVHQTSYLLRASNRETLGLIFRGELVARRVEDRIVIVPADNAELLMAATLLRLPLPEPATDLDSRWIELTLTRRALRELNRRAALHNVTQSDLIETLLCPE